MVGLYFSGTGNSKYCLERFLQEFEESAMFSIEDDKAIEQIKSHTQIIIAYPVQYSNIPKILRDFIMEHSDLWKGKDIFIIATMGLFSGDGAGLLARLLKKQGAHCIGGLHVKMPDSIADEKALKRSSKKNKSLILAAEKKVVQAAHDFQNGRPTQDGIGFLSHLAGLFGQRLYFYTLTQHYSSKLKINSSQCIGCGRCVQLCPMKNIELDHAKAIAKDQCTMCYRCINQCPMQAITLLGKKVVTQYDIHHYL
ncbi:EFR1 family ferrodoxin [Beduini massiliensis]|uniref:EFR1 family ferrodoxin n=1 Tax=Beduini massiliensis TaxID=1585974 RepID=UPI00059A928D|nr:EFR1 family ferrodoxin [Beduini massiliensis]